MSDAQRPDMTPYALTSLGLRQVLTSQLELAKRLIDALVASGALTAEAAEAVLLGIADAAEKKAGRAQPLGESHFSDALKEPMREHAQALRGITKKIGARRAKAAGTAAPA
jgi:polyhydroxyalkanoate synthesis regulator phasin